jgi:hypothetical protein
LKDEDKIKLKNKLIKSIFDKNLDSFKKELECKIKKKKNYFYLKREE